MQRNVSYISDHLFDVVVVGGGITGANIARDAALRGLDVALVEAGDFGGATSANSLKTVHGGLRYLQDGNLPLMRKMIKERRAMLKVAPHLVRPLPVVMPTYTDRFMRSQPALGAAVIVNDLVSFDRNRGVDPERRLPNGKILSKKEILGILPDLDRTHLSGGIQWYDAQMVNTERLLWSILRSAIDRAAAIANYVRVTGFLRDGRRVTGVEAVDERTGRTVTIQGRIVVNACGPWTDMLLGELGVEQKQRRFVTSTAMNLVTRQIVPDHAVGLRSTYNGSPEGEPAQTRERVLFVAPWREYSLVGTIHDHHEGRPGEEWIEESMIQSLIDEINRAYPGARLRRHDVYQVHRGLLPVAPGRAKMDDVELVREAQVTDHRESDGIDGLVTAVGVKYTTARYLAEKTVDKVFEQLERTAPACYTHRVAVHGGDIEELQAFLASARWPVALSSESSRRLLATYGSAYRELFPILVEHEEHGRPLSEDTPILGAEVIHAIRNEMAVTLSDVVLRRTEMGSAGQPSDATLEACASVMARELGWDRQRQKEEMEEVLCAYPANRFIVPEMTSISV